MDQRSGRIWAFLCSALSGLLLFVALWVVVPPPTYLTLILAVAASEGGVWLAAGAAALILINYRGADASRLARLTLYCSAATIVLSSIPFLRFAPAAREFDEAMRSELGKKYLCAVPPGTRALMRSSPLNQLELVTGLRSGPAQVIRGVRYPVEDGVSLTMDIYRPSASGEYPAVVQIYGGAWQRGAPGDNAAFARYLASRGYVVFAIDYRHAPRWRWPTQLTDVRAALAWIVEHGREYDADPGRLALLGRSSGAQLALVSAYRDQWAGVRAVVSYYGPVDLVEGYRRPRSPTRWTCVESRKRTWAARQPKRPVGIGMLRRSPMRFGRCRPRCSSTPRATTSSRLASARFCTSGFMRPTPVRYCCRFRGRSMASMR